MEIKNKGDTPLEAINISRRNASRNNLIPWKKIK